MVRCEAHCELTYDGVLIFEHRGATGEGRAREKRQRSDRTTSARAPLWTKAVCWLYRSCFECFPFSRGLGLTGGLQEGRTLKSRVA